MSTGSAGRTTRATPLLAAACGLVTALAVALAAADGARIPVRPAAHVNGVTISERTVQQNLDRYLEQKGLLAGGIRNPEYFKDIRRDVLDILIDRELMWQDAVAHDLAVPAAEAEAVLERLREEASSSALFEARLKARGMDSEAYREHVRRQMSIDRLMAQRVLAGLTVDDEAVATYYRDHPHMFARPDEVRARHVLIGVAEDADAASVEDARQRAAAVAAAARAGDDFASLAREHSTGPSAASGGNLGFFPPGTMVTPFDRAVFAMDIGEVSDPVRTVYGFHVIRVEDRRSGGTVPLEQVASSIRDHLLSEARDRRLDEYLQGLRDAAQIEIVTSF